MSFITYNLKYYLDRINEFESTVATKESVYEAKQLLKVIDDLIDENYSELSDQIEEQYNGVTRLKNYIYSNGEEAFESNHQVIRKEIIYNKIDIELESEMDKIIFTTNRLYLREYKEEDYISLYNILADPETMKHYPKPYDEKMVKRWIDWNIENYREYEFGLWALITKDTNEFIGDCGITMQKIDGEYLAEIGYHINKNFWKNGFASEAAKAVRDWAFKNTELNSLYSYMTATNVGSYKTAIKNGMKKIKEYKDENNGLLYVYRITRDEWKSIKTE